MVKRLADNISNYISFELNYDDEKSEILSYGLQIFLGTSIKTVSILILAYILNIFETTVAVSLSFVIFRRIIGGSHVDTYNKCYCLSISLMILAGIAGEVISLEAPNILILILLIYVLAVIATILWIPAGTEKKMIRNKVTRKRIKIKTICLLTIWCLVCNYLNNIELFRYVTSSLLGVTLSFFLASPLGYKFTNF
ncbi:MAG: accessory gene regulator B family protein [Maledivibacter sp.]|jgi:accessory gene regulator B|nr:accessory gene regulator B family protein [Maledivibacter sp.]